MPTYSQADFCMTEIGLDYLFGKMSAIYGAAFTRHWENIDPMLIRQTWGEILGPYVSYRPALDFALTHMDKTYVPSALAVLELCRQAGRIPDKPHSIITKQATQAEIARGELDKAEALRKIREFTRSITH